MVSRLEIQTLNRTICCLVWKMDWGVKSANRSFKGIGKLVDLEQKSRENSKCVETLKFSQNTLKVQANCQR